MSAKTYLLSFFIFLTLTACSDTVKIVGDKEPEGLNYALRFYGNGSAAPNKDRVKIQIDNPENSEAGPAIDVGAENFTIEFWMKARWQENTAPTTSCGSGNGWINGNMILDRDRYSQSRAYGISLANGRIVFGVRGTNLEEYSLCGSTFVLDNQWHHILVQRRRSDGMMWIFIDGQLESQYEGPLGDISYPDDGVPGNHCNGACINSDPYLVIGAEKHDVGPEYPAYSGWIDELRISNALRFNSTFNRPSTELTVDNYTVGMFRFNEGTGTTLINESKIDSTNGLIHYGGSPAGPKWDLSTIPISNE